MASITALVVFMFILLSVSSVHPVVCSRAFAEIIPAQAALKTPKNSTNVQDSSTQIHKMSKKHGKKFVPLKLPKGNVPPASPSCSYVTCTGHK
ncbi:hypothetical protein O6H91_15G077600 [Diphasiastrum complanatum]|uniref:Uncharacterized protein n=1 Tax=Diphasiastrum complanatum TaxID=34168 RepID=A0ACC2BJX3_DIPCM|nr:hypothetical protein O6H91_15G077600 [Diphasiastrum complanatum]